MGGGLAPSDRRLRNRRVEVGVTRLEERRGRQVWIEWRTERFPTYAAARAFAEALPVDADHARVNLTGFEAVTGWRSQALGQRVDGVWR